MPILPETSIRKACSVADVNGLVWEVASEYIADTNGIHMVLKESEYVASLTSSNSYGSALYDVVSLPIALDNTVAKFGNGVNQFYDDCVDRNTNAYKIDSIEFPNNNNATSTSRSARFGKDVFCRYKKNEMALIVFGRWSTNSGGNLHSGRFLQYSTNL